MTHEERSWYTPQFIAAREALIELHQDDPDRLAAELDQLIAEEKRRQQKEPPARE